MRTDLLAASGGSSVLARTGDPNQAAGASWSRGGSVVVYSSSTAVTDGHPAAGASDLWRVPYAGGAGGAAAPVPGVNDPAYSQFYPTHSPGDALLAFNRNPRGAEMYDSPGSEVWVAPAGGGRPTRLAANDPPACSGLKSPGLTNSWPRWAPESTEAGGRRYYWLVFSSKRRPGPDRRYPPQLFVAGVTTRVEGGVEVVDSTYPAVYLTVQPARESNHTPAWDNFAINPG